MFVKKKKRHGYNGVVCFEMSYAVDSSFDSLVIHCHFILFWKLVKDREEIWIFYDAREAEEMKNIPSLVKSTQHSSF